MKWDADAEFATLAADKCDGRGHDRDPAGREWDPSASECDAWDNEFNSSGEDCEGQAFSVCCLMGWNRCFGEWIRI